MRVLPFFKPRKGWHVAGTNLEPDSGGGGGGVDKSMIAATESTSTSTHAYNVGDYFINASGQLCKATDDIAVNDTIIVGTGSGDNCVATTVGGELSELNSKFVTRAVSGTTDMQGQLNTGLVISDGIPIGFIATTPPGNYYNFTFSQSPSTWYLTFWSDTEFSFLQSKNVTGVLVYIRI